MRRLTSLMACGLAWMLLLTVSPEVRAQQFTGGLRGAVKDAAGVIPGVAVTLVNEETTAARNMVSNEAGEYLFSAVNPGTYTLRAVLQGFKTFDEKGIRIGTQQFITLDIIMEVGQIAEELTVRGQAPLIETCLHYAHVHDDPMRPNGSDLLKADRLKAGGIKPGTWALNKRRSYAHRCRDGHGRPRTCACSAARSLTGPLRRAAIEFAAGTLKTWRRVSCAF